VLVQNGSACSVDSSKSVVIDVNPKSKGGLITPQLLNICKRQNKGAILSVIGSTGNVLNWQSSTDSIVWNDFNPVKTDTSFSISNVNVPTKFRAILKSGVCPADTGKSAQVNIFNAFFPQSVLTPQDVSICFGNKATLQVTVTIGTNYYWLNTDALYDPNSRIISSNPYYITAQVAPASSTKYLLSTQNADCPNLRIDTFNVNVIPPLFVNAGNDTSVVVNQPLQLAVISSQETSGISYLWSPSEGLSSTTIYNPIATLGSNRDTITYFVKATTAFGCYAIAKKKITVYKTGPEIFVPSAFTPNGDGRNDIIKPIPVGIFSMDFFRVYNRWGQLLFSTSEINKGWDGTLNGTQQQSGTYIYMVQGKDYIGNTIFRKGTIVLIR
jgi:gliding motility-associated-like protein